MNSFLVELKERLEEARAEERDLSEYIRSLESLIALETKRQNRTATAAPRAANRDHVMHQRPKRRRLSSAGQPSPIKHFLMETMASGQGWSLDELKRAAREKDVAFDSKSPGHVLHFTLVALKNSGQTVYENSRWFLTQRAQQQIATEPSGSERRADPDR